VLSLLVCSAANAQRGALVVPRNLAELVEKSETIVVGHVVSARVEKHPEFRNLDTVVITLKVSETWKGSAGATFSFRQYVWDIRDRYEALGYRKGGEVLLLLYPNSRYGFTSPVAGGQGRFRIVRDRQGRAYAVNGFGNRGLFEGVDKQARQKGIDLSPAAARLVEARPTGPVALGELKQLIRQLAARD